jgi:glycosyltransferase involved in cell wall biosynthesis
MTTAPILSLILCTLERTIELDRLFQSLAVQSFKDFEVIVVDQNIDDRLLPYLEKGTSAGIAIKHIRHSPPNLSVARNIGIQVARGQWVGFPDDDCWYEPELLQVLSASFTRTEALAGAAASWAELSEPDELPLHLTWERSRVFRDRMLASFMVFFNRDLFDQIGDFDSRLGVGQWFGAGEETDLVMRALRAGASLTFYPSARVHHPIKLFQTISEARAVTRQRARGTGAIYAKHGLPLWVIVRGLVAPALRSLLAFAGTKDLLIGCMDIIGRWEGMLRWMYLNRHPVASDPPKFHAHGARQEKFLAGGNEEQPGI